MSLPKANPPSSLQWSQQLAFPVILDFHLIIPLILNSQLALPVWFHLASEYQCQQYCFPDNQKVFSISSIGFVSNDLIRHDMRSNSWLPPSMMKESCSCPLSLVGILSWQILVPNTSNHRMPLCIGFLYMVLDLIVSQWLTCISVLTSEGHSWSSHKLIRIQGLHRYSSSRPALRCQASHSKWMARSSSLQARVMLRLSAKGKWSDTSDCSWLDPFCSDPSGAALQAVSPNGNRFAPWSLRTHGYSASWIARVE